MTDISKIQQEVTEQLGNKETFTALVNTTFKAIPPELIKRATMEGMMRGFKFKDFLEKNIYAIGYGDQYSLVTSIDYARKVGMRGGVCGKSAPTYVENADGKIVSCTVTIQKFVNGIVGNFTATVFFEEYNTGKNQWKSRPRTMIAKVAEMHALRMACPEEAAQLYIEEEYQKNEEDMNIPFDCEPYKLRLKSVKNLNELSDAWATLPAEAKIDPSVAVLKEEMKEKFAEDTDVPVTEPIIQVEDKNEKK